MKIKLPNTKRISIFIICLIFTLSCKKISTTQDIPEVDKYPYKDYSISNDGKLIHTEMNYSDFQNSEDCAECHPNHFEEWIISSHGNSNSNLFFQKCIVDTKEEYGPNVDKFCNQCHSPISIISEADENISEIQSGVTCDICHTMTRVSSPTIALPHQIVTSQLFLNPGEGIKYGAMENPQDNTYHESKFNPIFNQSQLCLPCHDLRNENLETEITFTEWNRIPGMAMSGAFPCQQCHMPEKEDGTHEHHFAGVDLSYEVPPEEDPLYSDVINLIKTAAEISYESNLGILPDSLNWGNNINIPVRIESKTGHHLPSGTSFNRECWISIEVRENNKNGEILFQNGILNNSTQLLNYNDNHLIYFTSFLISEDGDTTQEILKASEIINYSLPGMNVKFADYEIELDNQINSIWIHTKLNFRPIKPFIFDELPNLKPNIPIYTIFEIEKTVHIIH